MFEQPDTSRPHPARMYDYYLGGKTNYLADREAAEEVIATFPLARDLARNQRDLMRRIVPYLARQGVDQFLDIGTGIPTEPNLHQIAQGIEPSTAVVYVDNDPIVRVYAQALMQSTPEGHTEFVLADIRDPAGIYAAPETAALDLTRPVALCLLGIVQFLPDDTDTPALIHALLDPLPPGSWVALSTLTHEFAPELWERLCAIYHARGMDIRTYTHREVQDFFKGLDLADPGVVLSNCWHPEIADSDYRTSPPEVVSMYAGVARKP